MASDSAPAIGASSTALEVNGVRCLTLDRVLLLGPNRKEFSGINEAPFTSLCASAKSVSGKDVIWSA